MKLFICKRPEKIVYDEYFGFVIRAASSEDAQKMVKEIVNDTDDSYFKDYTDEFIIEELTVQGEKDILLSDYKAG